MLPHFKVCESTTTRVHLKRLPCETVPSSGPVYIRGETISYSWFYFKTMFVVILVRNNFAIAINIRNAVSYRNSTV